MVSAWSVPAVVSVACDTAQNAGWKQRFVETLIEHRFSLFTPNIKHEHRKLSPNFPNAASLRIFCDFSRLQMSAGSPRVARKCNYYVFQHLTVQELRTPTVDHAGRAERLAISHRIYRQRVSKAADSKAWLKTQTYVAARSKATILCD